MARITETGVVSRDLDGWKTRIEEIFRSALGADLDLAPETPQGQLIGILAMMFTEVDENIVSLGNAMSVARAGGRQMDDLGSLLGIPRQEATRSTVTCDCGFALRPSGTWSVAVGELMARTSAGDEFRNVEGFSVTASGIMSVDFVAIETGPVSAPAGTLNRISSSIEGWETVTNPGDAVLGTAGETDAAYRVRYPELTDRGRNSVDTIGSAVREVSGVTAVRVEENSGDAAVVRQGVSIRPHGVAVIVQGGETQAIVDAIGRAKPAGTATSGTTNGIFSTEFGTEETIRFFRVDVIPVLVAVSLSTMSGFPSDGLGLIVSRIRAWFSGDIHFGEGLFDVSGVGIGESLDQNRLLSPVNSVPGHSVSSIAVTRKTGGASVAAGETINLNQRYVVEADADVTFTVS